MQTSIAYVSGQFVFSDTSGEVHVALSLLFRKGKIGAGSLCTHLARWVSKGGMDNNDVAPLLHYAGTKCEQSVRCRYRSLVLCLHTWSDARRLQFSGHHPSAYFIKQKGLYATMKCIQPSLIVGRRFPLAHDVIAIFIEMQMKAKGVMRWTPYAVVSWHIVPGIDDFFHNMIQIEKWHLINKMSQRREAYI